MWPSAIYIKFFDNFDEP